MPLQTDQELDVRDRVRYEFNQVVSDFHDKLQ